MPYCKMVTQVYQVNNCDECQGTCTTNPPDSGTGSGGGSSTGSCFIDTIMTPAIGQTMLALGMTFQLEIDFVNNVLGASAIGRRIVTMMKRHQPVTLRLMTANTELLGQAIRMWLIMTPFVQAIEACASNDGAAGKKRSLRFTRALHGQVVRLLRAFSAYASDKAFKKSLAELEAELAHYVGQTPEEVLRTLNRSRAGALGSAKRRR